MQFVILVHTYMVYDVLLMYFLGSSQSCTHNGFCLFLASFQFYTRHFLESDPSIVCIVLSFILMGVASCQVPLLSLFWGNIFFFLFLKTRRPRGLICRSKLRKFLNILLRNFLRFYHLPPFFVIKTDQVISFYHLPPFFCHKNRPNY